MKENIAKYANSQNAVSASDLQSNHPFHRKLEEISEDWLCQQEIQVLLQNGFMKEQEVNTKLKKESWELSSPKKFEVDYPRYQVITKNDLAKYENTENESSEVKLGAQRNFKITKFSQKSMKKMKLLLEINFTKMQ